MASGREKGEGSSDDIVLSELEEFEDVSLVLDTPGQMGKRSMWDKMKNAIKPNGFFNRQKGWMPLGTDEFSVAKDPRSYEGTKWAPEENANPLQRLFFTYINSLMDLGYQKHLQADDLWDLAKVDEAQCLVDDFQSKLESTIEPIKAPQGSVMRAMWRTHRAKFIFAGFIKLFHDILQFMSPVFLRELLRHLEDENSSLNSRFLLCPIDPVDPIMKLVKHVWLAYLVACVRMLRITASTDKFSMGALLAFAMFGAQIVQTVLMNQYFHIVYRIGLHLKAQLVQMLYRKSLRVTSAVKTKLGAGTIANFQSNDAAKLWALPSYLHIIWSGPFQILTVMAMLVKVLGFLPAFAGLMVTILLIPLNTVVGKIMAGIRKKKMGATDARVKFVSEIINGIKAVKLYAWEEPFSERVSNLRSTELKYVKRIGFLSALTRMFFSCGPILIALAGFGTYTARGGKLTASTAFPALALFQLLRFPVIMFPMQITNLINGSVALKRLQGFMESDEMDQEPPVPAVEPFSKKIALSVKNGTFSWGVGEEPVLKDINLEVAGGELLMVVGVVGSGKSSLLAALTGELCKISGKVKVAGSVSFTAQDSWIQHATVEKNVTFGKAMDEDRYAEVLHSCALLEDLQLLADGDQTEIGEKGVNLSGGQKQRVALARACYSNPDVALLDDPLSAVDAHVGRRLFDECISGVLNRTTRILVTHQVQYLPNADRVVVMRNGRIAEVGTYMELKNKGVDFSELSLQKQENGEDEKKASQPGGEKAEEKGGAKYVSAYHMNPEDSLRIRALVRQISLKGAGNSMKAEERSLGRVKTKIYFSYFMFWGPCILFPLLLLLTKGTESGLSAGQSFWLSLWTEGSKSDAFYMEIYFLLGLVSIVATLSSALILLKGSVNSSKTMHNKLLKTLMRLPMSFFDTQPSGRLINRFSRDVEALDGDVAPVISMALGCFTSVFVSIVVVVGVTWVVVVVILLLGYFYLRVQRRYLATTREIKRLDSLAMSPIFGHFGESLAGLQTIRACRLQKEFSLKNEHLINLSNRTNWPLVSANRWLSIKLEMMSGFIVFSTAIVVTVGLSINFLHLNAGLAGLALSSALNFTGLMNWVIRQITQLEVNMNCVERLLDYEQYETEKSAIVPGNRPPKQWPQTGAIVVTNLWVRYRPELDTVLNGLTFSVKGGEKIGVCGRTGCGKSTLMMALFRIVEAETGSVVIDGVDTSEIGLQDLRSKLSLVPQDPVIFSGKVRENLDPTNAIQSDAKLWGALRQAGLESFVQSLEGGLDAEISEGGGNLSCGQRQLLCMARALLRGTKILILDEATSNVDNMTDALIQQTIRSAFKDCTVLTIAHRIHTILDYDRVMVLDAGELKEFDTPKNLLVNTDSMFNKMVTETTKGNGEKVDRSDSDIELIQKVSALLNLS